MPPIRSIKCDKNGIEINDKNVISKLVPSDIPQTQTTPQDAKTWVNTNWSRNVTDYKVEVHIYSLSPFSAGIYTCNLGEVIPPNWWEET